MATIEEKLVKMNTSTPEAVKLMVGLGIQENFKKGAIITSPQHRFPILYFIKEGLARGYTENNGKETTFWLMDEGFILPSEGYFTKSSFPEYVEFLVDTEVWSINLIKASLLASQHPELYLMLLEIFEVSIFDAKGRECLLRITDAKERYLFLKATQPLVIYQLTKEILASFLRISAKQLSRIKAEDAKQV